MDKRIKLGIPFNFKPTWIAGPYYIANLIEALNLLNDEKKPHIIIYFDSVKSIGLLKDIEYPYISFKNQHLPFTRIIKILNKLTYTVIKKKLFTKELSSKEIDLLFPAADNDFFKHVPLNKKIYWIPDFQEHFYPDFFTKDVLSKRKKLQQKLVDSKATIVLSSKSSQTDFFTIYPAAKNKTHVLPFAVSHSKVYKETETCDLLEKFNLPADYYFCANQFWVHKNHITVLKSLALLKKRGKEIMIAFSGNQIDYRNPHFFKSLDKFVLDNHLTDNTRFLGFIDRGEQLALMKNSRAIIQPSLFEGWSTTVEDSKSLNKSVILSDIPIHREQLTKNVRFFDPLNEEQLAEILENFEPDTEFYDYTKNRIEFATIFDAMLANGLAGFS